MTDEMRQCVDQILRLREYFTGTGFEVLHSSWEKLMRHVRQSEESFYSKIPLNSLYGINLQGNAISAASCCVDACSTLVEIKYFANTKVKVKPNTIYNPDRSTNPGWDRMIIMEAFPSGKARRNLSSLFSSRINSVV